MIVSVGSSGKSVY